MTHDTPDSAQPGTVDIGRRGPGISVVRMRGEHDISTEPLLARALADAGAHSHVVVDLSECTFIDSTVISSLIAGATSARARSERFALVIPPGERQVARVAGMVRLSEILEVHESQDAALASFGQ